MVATATEPKGIVCTARPPKIYDNRQTTPLMEARHLQRVVFHAACQKKATAIQLSALARAWAILQESIRMIRGIPSPGQYRPDLDPVQLQRAIKRSRGRSPLEVATTITAAFETGADDEPAAGQKPTAKPMQKELDTPSDSPPNQIATPEGSSAAEQENTQTPAEPNEGER